MTISRGLAITNLGVTIGNKFLRKGLGKVVSCLAGGWGWGVGLAGWRVGGHRETLAY